jgi:hypothetical protein
MKFHFENIGLLDDADLELADLTVICGDNNTGKTYATYAIYGLLRSWRRLLYGVLRDEIECSIQPRDKYQLNLQEMFGGKVNNYLERLGKHYQMELPKVFSAKHGSFDESCIRLSVDERPEFIGKAFQSRVQDGPAGKVLATLTKEKEKHVLEVLVADDEFLQASFGGLSEFIADAISDLVFSPYFPRPHIIPRLQKVIDNKDQGGITKTVSWQGGGGFRSYKLAGSLIVHDRWGNPQPANTGRKTRGDTQTPDLFGDASKGNAP